jgi:cytochrome c-type biogenesis protein CcmH
VIAALIIAAVLGGDIPLDNPRNEARAQELMREIRCVVCENEPVSQSTADAAIDMRRVIREQVAKGQTNEGIRKYFSERYGEKVLFRPSAEGAGLLIWLFPFLLLVGAGGVIFARSRARKSAALPPLPDEGLEEAQS